jgi:hypothetical protein
MRNLSNQYYKVKGAEFLYGMIEVKLNVYKLLFSYFMRIIITLKTI